jgi:hypothetical protein
LTLKFLTEVEVGDATDVDTDVDMDVDTDVDMSVDAGW